MGNRVNIKKMKKEPKLNDWNSLQGWISFGGQTSAQERAGSHAKRVNDETIITSRLASTSQRPQDY